MKRILMSLVLVLMMCSGVFATGWTTTTVPDQCEYECPDCICSECPRAPDCICEYGNECPTCPDCICDGTDCPRIPACPDCICEEGKCPDCVCPEQQACPDCVCEAVVCPEEKSIASGVYGIIGLASAGTPAMVVGTINIFQGEEGNGIAWQCIGTSNGLAQMCGLYLLKKLK